MRIHQNGCIYPLALMFSSGGTITDAVGLGLRSLSRLQTRYASAAIRRVKSRLHFSRRTANFAQSPERGIVDAMQPLHTHPMTPPELLANLMKLRDEIRADNSTHVYNTPDDGPLRVTQSDRLAACDKAIEILLRGLAEAKAMAA